MRGAHRELVIANLSIAAGAYQDAFTYVKGITKKTLIPFAVVSPRIFRAYFLYKQPIGGSINLFERQLASYNSILIDIGKTPELILQDKLISAHVGKSKVT